METGHNQDPGVLSPEDERTLLKLDKTYRHTRTDAMIPSRTKEWTFYLMSHRPPGSTDPDSPDYSPNHYMFFVMGPKGERAKDKVFVLFMDETTSNYIRVVDVAGLHAQYEAQGLDEDDMFADPNLEQEFWKTVIFQGELGTSVPNYEDMQDFGDIVSSWQHQVEKEA